jgi:pyoverdine/dityrosine biosynthesis protein Dit1
MSLPDLSKLETYHNKVDIIKATAKQIIKDFKLFDEKIVFEGQAETAYQELFQQILPIIDRLINLDSSRFFSLLYAIDVEESKIKQLLFKGGDFDPAEEITHLIIRRELIKVIIRKHYSNSL